MYLSSNWTIWVSVDVFRQEVMVASWRFFVVTSRRRHYSLRALPVNNTSFSKRHTISSSYTVTSSKANVILCRPLGCVIMIINIILHKVQMRVLMSVYTPVSKMLPNYAAAEKIIYISVSSVGLQSLTSSPTRYKSGNN